MVAQRARNREDHIVSCSSLPTDLSGKMCDELEFVNGREYLVTLKDSLSG